MAVSVKKGTFSAATSTGNQAVTGVGFQGKAVLLFGVQATATGFQAGGGWFFGAATGTANRWAKAGFSANAAAGGDSWRENDTAACIHTITDATGAADGVADFVSFDSDGFTINWSNAPASAWIVHYLVIGGSDVSAKALTFDQPAAVGAQALTGAGFKPKALLACHVFAGSSGVHNSMGLGFATSTTVNESVSMFHRDRDAVATTDHASVQLTDRCITGISSTAATVLSEAKVASWDADGATMNWVATPGIGTGLVGYLFLGGTAKYMAGADEQRTSTGTKLTPVGMAPAGVIVGSFTGVASAGIDTGTTDWCVGASDGTDDGHFWHSAQDGQTTSNVDVRTDTTSLMGMATQPSTVNADGAVSSMAYPGFTIDWTTADASPRQFIYLAIGTDQPSARPMGDHPFRSTWLQRTPQLVGALDESTPAWLWWMFADGPVLVVASDSGALADAVTTLTAAGTATDSGALTEAVANALAALDSAALSEGTPTIDTGGTDVLAVDSAALTEAVAIALAGLADSGTLAEAVANRLATTDQGTLTEAVALALPATDLATLAEAVALHLAGADAATLADATTALAAALAGADAHTLAEAVAMALPAADTASSTDAGTLSAALGGADSGAGGEGTPAVSLPGTDAASGTEGASSLAASTTGADSGTATDANGGIALAGTDSGTGSDSGTLAAALVASDDLALADAAALAAAVAGADTAALADASALAAALAGADLGTLAEVVAGLQLAVADAGALAEAVAGIALDATDAAALAAESGTVDVGGTDKAALDSFTLAEAVALALAGADLQALAEGEPAVGLSGAADQGTGAEGTPAVGVAGTDAASTADVAALAAVLTATDALAAAEATTLAAALAASDTAAATDALQQLLAAVAAADGLALAESAQVQVLLVEFQDSRLVVRVPAPLWTPVVQARLGYALAAAGLPSVVVGVAVAPEVHGAPLTVTLMPAPIDAEG